MNSPKLTRLLQLIEMKIGSPLNENTELKINTILFFSYIDYYTIEGKPLFKEAIRCYYNMVKIDNLTIQTNALDAVEIIEVDALVDDILTGYVELFESMNDADLLAYLYDSKAFLYANLARGQRLTQTYLSDYHDTYSRFINGNHDTIIDINIDGVDPRYDLIEELEADLSIEN